MATVTVREASAMLGMAGTNVRKRIQEGKLQGEKVGLRGDYVVDLESVRILMQKLGRVDVTFTLHDHERRLLDVERAIQTHEPERGLARDGDGFLSAFLDAAGKVAP